MLMTDAIVVTVRCRIPWCGMLGNSMAGKTEIPPLIGRWNADIIRAVYTCPQQPFILRAMRFMTVCTG